MSETVTAPPPDNANAECVGPSSDKAGKADGCAGCPNQASCASGSFNSPEAIAKQQKQQQELQASLQNVSHVLLVLSGKGGVGKSTVAAQLAHTLASQGYAVGLLDVDLCGPSAPRMILGEDSLQASVSRSAAGSWIPVYSKDHPNLACMSISFLLEDSNAAVVWRGPRKNGLIEQFLTQVDWTGETDGLDYLIVDTPPGTSDEHISTVQYLQKATGAGTTNATTGAQASAVLVTTPEEVSMADVRKELNFCQKTKLPVLGIIENMGSYATTLSQLKFVQKPSTNSSNNDTSKVEAKDITEEILAKLQAVCPEALEVLVTADIFPRTGGGPEAMAEHYQVPYWGKIPLDPNVLKACEKGKAFVETHPDSPAAHALQILCQKITTQLPVEEVVSPS